MTTETARIPSLPSQRLEERLPELVEFGTIQRDCSFETSFGQRS